jgi:hypothetical protein
MPTTHLGPLARSVCDNLCSAPARGLHQFATPWNSSPDTLLIPTSPARVSPTWHKLLGIIGSPAAPWSLKSILYVVAFANPRIGTEPDNDIMANTDAISSLSATRANVGIWVLISASGAFLSLRLWLRHRSAKFWWDDLMLSVSWVCIIGESVHH